MITTVYNFVHLFDGYFSRHVYHLAMISLSALQHLHSGIKKQKEEILCFVSPLESVELVSPLTVWDLEKNLELGTAWSENSEEGKKIVFSLSFHGHVVFSGKIVVRNAKGEAVTSTLTVTPVLDAPKQI